MVDWGVYWQIIQGNQYLSALLVLIAAVIVAKLFQEVFLKILEFLTRKTKSNLDDKILAIASRPVFFLILLLGLYIGLRALNTFYASYKIWIDGTFYILAMVVIAWTASKILGLVITRWFRSHRGLSGTPKLINIIIATIIYIAAVIMILSFFDIEVTPFVAALGVGGLAIGLALQDTLANIFAGLHIIGDEPIRVHDVIELHGANIKGTVEDIGWRSTRISTTDHNRVIIPNNTIAQSILINYEQPSTGMRIPVYCGVDYGADLTKVEKTTLAVAKLIQKKVPEADTEWEPVFRYEEFADSNVNFRVLLRAKTRTEGFIVKTEFMKALHKEFTKKKIEISWPVQKLYHMNGLKLKK